MNRNAYVLTVIFNPFRFKSRTRLYNQFKKHMRETGAELFTVEIAFGGRDFCCTSADNPMNLQLRSDTVIWHKERGLNLGRQRLLHLIPDARFIFWVDADVTFANRDWAQESVHQLEHHHVIQPFSEAINLNKQNEYMWNCPSSFKSFITDRGYHQHPPLPVAYTYKGHPGLAWGATVDALDALGGLYDTCIAGSADTVMSNSLKGDWSVYLPAPPSAGMIASMKRWAAKCDKFVKTNVGFTRGAILHHWHGASEARGYDKRWQILSFHQFDPLEDLTVAANGLYTWAGNKPQMEDDTRLSLGARNEDE